ncbi:Fic family protein [Levilactobacillus acidifarinae]|uniref:Fido domain-containing protein n=1 Tax=Levilactobacillus acidifarinae DSM 19394 = JCM 15949 TaxID=1423715 RepID=A0A0R1LQK3_9LACO|nr:Fic family protein [Levilactobacillus acidifarinae]KRK95033.1 hypothetical protein FD25_GL002219 [Levilactobacillus acidifarinae DSM 19394]GEO70573.1 hypothetical protein LAC03_24830 [Levilactobacillus acidifarinae]
MNFANQYVFDRAAIGKFVEKHLAQLVTATSQLDEAPVTSEQNLQRAYQGLLSRNTPLVAADVVTLNQIVCAGTSGAGRLRSTAASATSTSWTPPIPDTDRNLRDLTAILTTQKSTTEKAMEVALYLSRYQLFTAGNQRTALVAANALMIDAGAGVLAIPAERLDWYRVQLEDYQRTGRGLVIKQWLYRNAVWGAPGYRAVEQPQHFHQNKYSPLNGPLTRDEG